jgi:ssDNA-binding Zn-finger/Zn-ribbon topoisomerase 1
VGVVALVLVFIFPPGFFIFLPIAWWAFQKESKGSSVDAASFLAEFVDAEQEVRSSVSSWQVKVGLPNFRLVKESLGRLKAEWDGIEKSEKVHIERFRNNVRDRQLHQFLDQFSIRGALIKGLGDVRLATLTSFGIDTAAGVSQSRVESLPGFGEKLTRELIEWRSSLERKFVFRVNDIELEKQEAARLRSISSQKRKTIATEMAKGLASLEQLSKKFEAVSSVEDPSVSKAITRRAQARKDLEFLGIPVPVVPAQPVTIAPSPNPAPRQRGGHVGSAQGVPVCPRCGSSMIARVAKRGARAGSRFWGCSRYPACKGTRSI